MIEKQKTKIGKIIDAHGIRGEISIHIFSGDISWLDQLKEVSLLYKNELQEYKVLKKRAYKKGFICHLETFVDRNKAEQYTGSEVWIDSSFFVSQEGEALYLKEILNFEIEDVARGKLGIITSFSFNGSQDLLVVERAGQSDLEIPFVKAFVTVIDYQNKKIHMDLPEGLIEINDPE
jgi:16S rRNA processing protein RimM